MLSMQQDLRQGATDRCEAILGISDHVQGGRSGNLIWRLNIFCGALCMKTLVWLLCPLHIIRNAYVPRDQELLL